MSDGSTDDSAAIARAQAGVAVHEYHPNRGKGAAVRHGIERASGELILIQDADLEYDPQDYLALLPPLCDGRAQVVYGSRLLGYEKQFGKGTVRRHRGAYRSAYLGGRVVTELANLLYGAHLTDAPTCYKCFRTDVIRAHRNRARSVRLGTGGHGQAPAQRDRDLRGANQLPPALVRRGQENRGARRPLRALDAGALSKLAAEPLTVKVARNDFGVGGQLRGDRGASRRARPGAQARRQRGGCATAGRPGPPPRRCWRRPVR